jgi:hypothetical protein
MQPEILHRCASCGASIREPAMFCPECGKPLAPVAANVSPDAEQPAIAEIPGPFVTPSTELVESGKVPLAVAAGAAPEDVKADPVSSNKTYQPTEPGTTHRARERTRERLHRASSVARGALEDNVKRVEKIHDFSTAVIEEATYDPSLRFVLVALGLFVVFVILLVLSKVMG